MAGLNRYNGALAKLTARKHAIVNEKNAYEVSGVPERVLTTNLHPHYRSWGICDRNGKTCVTGQKRKFEILFSGASESEKSCAWHRSSHVSGFRGAPPGPTQFPEGSPLSAVKRSATGISWLTLQSGHRQAVGTARPAWETRIMRRVTLVIGPSKVSIRRSGWGWHALRRIYYPRDN